MSLFTITLLQVLVWGVRDLYYPSPDNCYDLYARVQCFLHGMVTLQTGEVRKRKFNEFSLLKERWYVLTFIDSKMLAEILLFIRNRTRSQDTTNEEHTLNFLLIIVVGILHYAFLIWGEGPLLLSSKYMLCKYLHGWEGGNPSTSKQEEHSLRKKNLLKLEPCVLPFVVILCQGYRPLTLLYTSTINTKEFFQAGHCLCQICHSEI